MKLLKSYCETKYDFHHPCFDNYYSKIEVLDEIRTSL